MRVTSYITKNSSYLEHSTSSRKVAYRLGYLQIIHENRYRVSMKFSSDSLGIPGWISTGCDGLHWPRETAGWIPGCLVGGSPLGSKNPKSYPKRWFLFGKMRLRWMMKRGSPILGNPQLRELSEKNRVNLVLVLAIRVDFWNDVTCDFLAYGPMGVAIWLIRKKRYDNEWFMSFMVY